MSIIRIISGGVVVGLCFAGTANAQPACFCLAHKTTAEIVHFGCEARSIGTRGIERVTCLDAERVDRARVGDHATFERIAAGSEACNPCYAPPEEDPEDTPRDLEAVAEDAEEDGS